MPRGKISNSSVRNAKPGDRDVYLWDTDLTGFGLKVTPTGKKVFLVQYRSPTRAQRRNRRVTIGRWSDLWTPDSARKEAKRLLGEVAAGRDPADEKKRPADTLSVTQLCDLYMAEGTTAQKTSTRERDKSRIERHIKPLIGDMLITEVDSGVVERLQRDIADGKTKRDIKTKSRGRSIVSGGRGAAREVVVRLSAIFSFAIRRELCEKNPVVGVRKFPTRKVERFLTEKQMAELGDALRVEEAAGANPYGIAAIRVLALTGCRLGEIIGLKREWIDADRLCLRLPDSKTGQRVIPIGEDALVILTSLPTIAGNPYVFPGSRSDSHFKGLKGVWEKVRTRAGVPDLRLHDLRHTFGGFGVSGGASLYVVGKVLGHSNPATTQRYAHMHDDPVRRVVEGVSGRISDAMSGGGDLTNQQSRDAEASQSQGGKDSG